MTFTLSFYNCLDLEGSIQHLSMILILVLLSRDLTLELDLHIFLRLSSSCIGHFATLHSIKVWFESGIGEGLKLENL
jgi:hypothetical protein